MICGLSDSNTQLQYADCVTQVYYLGIQNPEVTHDKIVLNRSHNLIVQYNGIFNIHLR